MVFGAGKQKRNKRKLSAPVSYDFIVFNIKELIELIPEHK